MLPLIWLLCVGLAFDGEGQLLVLAGRRCHSTVGTTGPTAIFDALLCVFNMPVTPPEEPGPASQTMHTMHTGDLKPDHPSHSSHSSQPAQPLEASPGSRGPSSSVTVTTSTVTPPGAQAGGQGLTQITGMAGTQ